MEYGSSLTKGTQEDGVSSSLRQQGPSGRAISQRLHTQHLTLSLGFHELRLPPSYILGTRILMHDGGKIERVVGRLTGSLHVVGFITVPSMYLVYTIIGQLKFRAHSIIGVLVLSLSLLFIIVGLATVFLSNRLDFPEVESDIGETKN